MKKSINKPLIIFALFLISVGYFVVRTKDIHLPSFAKDKIKTISFESKNENEPADLKEVDGSLEVAFDYLEDKLNSSSFIKNTDISKEKEEIAVEGISTIPFEAKLITNIKLYVQNKNLIGNITYVKVGKIESPPFVEDRITNYLQGVLDKEINNNYEIKDVKIENEKLILTLI